MPVPTVHPERGGVLVHLHQLRELPAQSFCDGEDRRTARGLEILRHTAVTTQVRSSGDGPKAAAQARRFLSRRMPHSACASKRGVVADRSHVA